MIRSMAPGLLTPRGRRRLAGWQELAPGQNQRLDRAGCQLRHSLGWKRPVTLPQEALRKNRLPSSSRCLAEFGFLYLWDGGPHSTAGRWPGTALRSGPASFLAVRPLHLQARADMSNPLRTTPSGFLQCP